MGAQYELLALWEEFSAEEVGDNQGGAALCCPIWFKARSTHSGQIPTGISTSNTSHSHAWPCLSCASVLQSAGLYAKMQLSLQVTISSHKWHLGSPWVMGTSWLDAQPRGRLQVGEEVTRGKNLWQLCNYKTQDWHPPTWLPGILCPSYPCSVGTVLPFLNTPVASPAPPPSSTLPAPLWAVLLSFMQVHVPEQSLRFGGAISMSLCFHGMIRIAMTGVGLGEGDLKSLKKSAF